MLKTRRNADVTSDDDSAMLSRIRLSVEEAGMFIGVDLQDGVASLSGAVESDESRTAAIDVASAGVP
jgi:osmotically-inducible protein OsmY